MDTSPVDYAVACSSLWVNSANYTEPRSLPIKNIDNILQKADHFIYLCSLTSLANSQHTKEPYQS